MTVSLSKPLRRIIALALLAVLISTLVIFAILPVRETMSRSKTEHRREQVMIAKLERRIETLSQAEIEPVEDINAPLLWPAGGTSGAGGALIQSAIQRIASEAQAPLRSISAWPSEPFAGQAATKLLVEARIPYDRAAAFLEKIDHHKPRLLVETLNMRALPRGSSLERQPLLQLRLEILAPQDARADGAAE